MFYSFLLGERWKILSKMATKLVTVRTMGGGPRTFPGGLNKWQFKRMHEKMAREKERKLLDQEKQIYQARLRSQIRATVSGRSPPKGDAETSSKSEYSPITPAEHVKSLADRFIAEGAEDLWNEDDGPLSDDQASNNQESSRPEPLDLRKMVSDRCLALDDSKWKSTRSAVMPGQRRHYSSDSGRKNKPKPSLKTKWYPDSDSDSEYEAEFGISPKFLGKKSLIEDSCEGEDAHLTAVRKSLNLSSAALRNHDRKKERRPLNIDEKEKKLDEDVEFILDDLKRRRSQDASATERKDAEDDTLLTHQRFEELSISPLTLKALTSAGYVHMTTVQSAALPICLDGKDAVVKARTGTGKSIAFLIPTIETVLKRENDAVKSRLPPILALILCPTRELASQIAAEANVLIRHHSNIGVLSLIGGTRFKLDQQRLDSNPCQIIVATPGRLLDHIENKSGFSLRLMGLKMLVLDEGDHLLDLGFRKDIEKIVDCLPRDRQSLLFSATVPREVRRISQVVLRRDHVYVNTVGINDQDTPPKVMQSYIIAPHSLHFDLVYHLLKEHIEQEADYKVIVFCTTAMLAQLTFTLLHNLKLNVKEVHSRKTQLHRTRVSDEFRESKRTILVTSDISSRGTNYPDVTLVIQMGVPCDREQYIHRLGRTGREGKSGRGIMLLAPFEEYFLDGIIDLPIQKQLIPCLDSVTRQKIEESMRNVVTSIKEGAYHAWLGYYNSISETGRDKTTLAELACQFSSSMGLQCPPALFRKTILKMGLKDIAGIRERKS